MACACRCPKSKSESHFHSPRETYPRGGGDGTGVEGGRQTAPRKFLCPKFSFAPRQFTLRAGMKGRGDTCTPSSINCRASSGFASP